jgi:hypothetical protein
MDLNSFVPLTDGFTSTSDPIYWIAFHQNKVQTLSLNPCLHSAQKQKLLCRLFILFLAFTRS